jgi:hypothetical protein
MSLGKPRETAGRKAIGAKHILCMPASCTGTLSSCGWEAFFFAGAAYVGVGEEWKEF